MDKDKETKTNDNDKKRLDDTQGASRSPDLSPQDLIGKQIGNYKIIKELGRGGMAIVYEAYEKTLDRNVALKIIPKTLTGDPQYVERFKREASAAAKLSHANIVPIYGFGEYNDTCYYAMALATGKTLSDMIDDKKHDLLKSARRFNIAYALEVIEKLASALSYAHKQGVIHRDIKPSNIIIDEKTNRILITDFGLAKSLARKDITPTSAFFGSPPYMSPEQAQGLDIDNRTDIYSLGAVLYEMLTGSPPFTGDSILEIINKVKSESLVPASVLNPNIPSGLETIILKAMSKDIFLRYENFDQFIADIHSYNKGLDITSAHNIKEIKEKQKVNIMRKIYLSLFVVFLATLLALAFYFTKIYWKKRVLNNYLVQQFQLAENYENVGLYVTAKEIYGEIIERYPNTTYAEKAKDKFNNITVF